MMQPEISVVICAYTEKRWDDILLAIDSVRRQTKAAEEIILVIDHNPLLLERSRQAHLDVKVVENAGARGLSGARNTGVSLAKGQVIAFLDDDAEAAPDWLQQLVFWYGRDEVVGVGGVVEPKWEGTRPAWFPNEFYWVVGCSYRGLPEASGPVRNLFGGCMCIRRQAFDLVGGFQSEIGRSEGRPMGCEETEFCIRVHQHRPDWKFMYEPRAWAFHRVSADRARWAYFRSRCYAEGLSKAQVVQLVGAGDGLSSERSYTTRALPLGVLRGVVDVVWRGDPAGLLRAGAIVAGLGFTSLGFAVGLVTGWRQKRAQQLEAAA